MKKELLFFGYPYSLDLQMFADEDGNDDGLNSNEPNNDVNNDDGDNGNNDQDNGKKEVKLTQSQLNDRLKREREKAIKEATEKANENLAKIIAEEFDRREKKKEEDEKFANMTEKDRREALQKKKEEELQKREDELNSRIKVLETQKAVDTIMEGYDKDNLPRRDLFRPIAELMAMGSADQQVACYNAFKEIVKDVESKAFKESLKQNPPKDGSSQSSTEYSSTNFANEINKRNSSKKDDGWGGHY